MSFESFLIGCLNRKFATEMTAKGRDKRSVKIEVEDEETGEKKRILIQNYSLDIPINENGMLLGETIPDKINIETEIIDKKAEEYSDRMLMYLNKLSNIQRKVLKLTVSGYSATEIIEELHISNKEYTDSNIAIRSYRNVSILF